MRLVIQRVISAVLSVDGRSVSRTGKGLIAYIGVGKGDEEKACEVAARKITSLRIFSDDAGKMNLSLSDINGEAMLVSQFTLYGDARKGNRPSFTEAELPERAKALYDRVCELTEAAGIKVGRGIFGADMCIDQVCDGPVTIILDI